MIKVFYILSLCMSNLSCSCSWNATYESLLGTNKRFYKPIPLSVSTSILLVAIYMCGIYGICRLLLTINGFNWQEMVEFLVDRWEQEGLYDWGWHWCVPKYMKTFFVQNFLQLLLEFSWCTAAYKGKVYSLIYIKKRALDRAIVKSCSNPLKYFISEDGCIWKSC